MKTKNILTFILVVLCTSIGITYAKTMAVDQSFKVKAGGTLYLDSDSGSVEVESHSAKTVIVEVQKWGENEEDFEVTVEQDGNDIKIEGDQKGSGSYWGRNAQVRYLIKVPSQYNVDVKTGGGSIEISDLNGVVEARTSGGSISLGKINGDVDVKTSGGSIRVDDVVGNIDAHTSGGSIRATISKQPTQDSKLTTSGGSITAYLAEGIAVDLNASTSGGRVKSEFDVVGKVKKTSIKGEINGGGPDLYLRTSGGSVKIKKT